MVDIKSFGASFRYNAFGCVIASDFRLRFPAGEADALSPAEVRIAPGQVTDRFGSARFSRGPGEQDITIRFSSGLRFRVQDGDRIIVDRGEGVSEDEIQCGLMGAAMGVLALQRELLPLHASAVEVGGECVAFVGRSGSGKSTLAACLARRGYPLLADDMVTVGFDAGGAAIAWRAAPEVKLWDSALDAIGETGPELIQVRPGLAKYYAPVTSPSADSLPLRRIYLLDGATAPRPRGLAAMRALKRHCHGSGRASVVLGEARQLGRLTQLLRSVTVERLDIQHGLERLHDEVTRVEARIADPAAT